MNKNIFLSINEPTDLQLKKIMKEVAVEARKKAEKTKKLFQKKIEDEIKKLYKQKN